MALVDGGDLVARAIKQEGVDTIYTLCGVALVPAAPGVPDCVPPIANAYQNRSPLLVIGGRSPLARFEMGALQDMNQVDLLRSITKWARCVYDTQRIPEYIASAFRAALTGRQGPAFLEIPTDVLFRKVEE